MKYKAHKKPEGPKAFRFSVFYSFYQAVQPPSMIRLEPVI